MKYVLILESDSIYKRMKLTMEDGFKSIKSAREGSKTRGFDYKAIVGSEEL